MNNIDNESSAKRLKRLRISKHMTQEQMAEAIGISESLYKGNECGRLPISKKTAQLIEECFGFDADYIYHGTLRDTDDIWLTILECDEMDKMKLMLRLIRYFSLQGAFDFSDCAIDNIISDMGLK